MSQLKVASEDGVGFGIVDSFADQILKARDEVDGSATLKPSSIARNLWNFRRSRQERHMGYVKLHMVGARTRTQENGA